MGTTRSRKAAEKASGKTRTLDSFLVKGSDGGDDAPKKEKVAENGGEKEDEEVVEDADEEILQADAPKEDVKMEDDVAVVQAEEEDAPEEEKVVEEKPDVKSSIPLVCQPRLEDKVVLVEAADESFDLSGDVGAVGRVRVGDDDKLTLDLKGVFYDTGRVATNSICVVTVTETEAKISAIVDDVLLLAESTEEAGGEKLVEGNIDFVMDNDADGGKADGGGKGDGSGRKRKEMDGQTIDEKIKAAIGGGKRAKEAKRSSTKGSTGKGRAKKKSKK